MATARTSLPQAAAIPVRAGLVCLVTSRRGRRLVVPKGRMEHGRTPKQIALQEAWEEAGLIGVVNPRPIGRYRYEKASSQFDVVVFIMEVTDVEGDWPECNRRSRHWMDPARAIAQIDNPGLRRLLKKLVSVSQPRRARRARAA